MGIAKTAAARTEKPPLVGEGFSCAFSTRRITGGNGGPPLHWDNGHSTFAKATAE
jgi:hypothetical protein